MSALSILVKGQFYGLTALDANLSAASARCHVVR